MKAIGRPKSKKPKNELFNLRLTGEEKQAFSTCATLSGIPMAAWVRERLRKAAIRDLEEAGQKIPFLRILE
jgi:predicted HicB family RNase H-like nuclease